MDSFRTGGYQVTFLSRHPVDKHLCDNVACWWPEWYNNCFYDSNIPVYGARMILNPRRKSDLIMYLL